MSKATSLRMHPSYARLRQIAYKSHEKGRAATGITAEDIALARLYSYAYRLHTIGAFHATRKAIQSQKFSGLAEIHRERAMEALADLANQGMDPIGDDFRVLVSTFYRYDCCIRRVMDALQRVYRETGKETIRRIAKQFRKMMEEISTGNGIHLTQDTHAPEQGSFIVPNLGITIVPLVYGDHHSWNLAYLNGARSDVPFHRHHEGVEIHLGYGPLKGNTVLGDCYAEVTEGYAMPIPPMIRHGYINASEMSHHLPFIFGSLKQAGWGVFLDVEAQPMDLRQMKKVPVQSRQMGDTIFLEREIARAAEKTHSWHNPIIKSSVTDRHDVGGLELSVARVSRRGFVLPSGAFRIISVVRGQGVVQMGGVERKIAIHDHFGIPSGISAFLRQEGKTSLVILDAMMKGSHFTQRGKNRWKHDHPGKKN